MAKRKFAIGEYELVVRRSRTGRGFFTVDPIERGRCIVEYTGRVLSEAEEYTSNSKYLFAVNKRKTIDGRKKTNIARYIVFTIPAAKIWSNPGGAGRRAKITETATGAIAFHGIFIALPLMGT